MHGGGAAGTVPADALLRGNEREDGMNTDLRAKVAILIAGLAVLVPARADADHSADGAAAHPPETCYIVADGTPDAKDEDAPDLLTRVVRADHNPETNETNIGDGTGTFNMEAIALQPGTGVLFAADAGRLGTVDLETGEFAALGLIGTGDGPEGVVKFNDVDGLAFDATTGFLYGTQREVPGEDLLLRIDPATGTAVVGGLAGADYAVVPAVADLPDIDDIAVDPLDGQMYAVANDDGRKDHLVKIDKLTGQATDIGVLEAQDVEGLGFASGQLIGTTGKNLQQEGIWDIDKLTGKAINRRALDNGRDYEAFDCLNPPNPLGSVPVLACLEIMEDAVPDDAQDFAFTTTGGLPEPELILDDDTDGTLPSSRTFCDLAAGPYTVTQQTPPSWPLTGVTCTDPSGDSASDLAGGRAAVMLTGGETVRCVFVNTQTQVLGEEVSRGPEMVLPAPAPVEPAAAQPELPRTGSDRLLVVLSGAALALGGLGVIGGTRRRSRRPSLRS